MSDQPEWELIAQLGDASPLDYGGYFIFRDKTGVYEAQGEWLEELTEDIRHYTIYRFDLDRCTYQNGILSDNKFHPNLPAWFAKPESKRAERPQDTTYLANVARCCGVPVETLIAQFCSEDPIERAWAYRDVGLHHGFANFDSYPLELNKRDAKARYRKYLKR